MNKHTATHNGQTFKRNSENAIYTHTVVSKPAFNYEQALAHAKADKHYDSKWIAYCKEAASLDYKYASVTSDKDRAEYVRQVEIGPDALNAEVAARQVARVEENNAKGYYEAFQNAGWCGRADLAQKLAEKTRKYGHREVTILVAEVK